MLLLFCFEDNSNMGTSFHVSGLAAKVLMISASDGVSKYSSKTQAALD